MQINILLVIQWHNVNGDQCKSDYHLYKTKTPKSIGRNIQTFIKIQTSKWNKLIPTHDELAEVIQFWCIEP